jgi:predicted dehydrogenase
MSGLRAIVVGTSFGLRVHIPALRAAGFDVVALVGTDPDRTRRRAERAGIPIAVTSLEQALADTDAQVVTIATPPDTHHRLTLAAIAAGRHVICEKPMALTTAEAESMTAAAAAAGVIAIVGHEFRWAPAIEAIRIAIHEGLIGDVHTATMTRFYPILAAPDALAPAWWFDQERGGGWLRANGTHLIDQLRMWLGDFAQVSADIYQGIPRAAGCADDSYIMQFRTESGAFGVLQESAAVWGEGLEVSRIVGTRGALSIEGERCTLSTREGTRVLVEGEARNASDGARPWTSTEIANYSRLTGWLADTLSGGGADSGPRPASFADGLAVLRIIDAAEQSTADRRPTLVKSTSKDDTSGRDPSTAQAVRG